MTILFEVWRLKTKLKFYNRIKGITNKINKQKIDSRLLLGQK